MNLYKALYCGLYRLYFYKKDKGAAAAALLMSVLVFLNGLTALHLLQAAPGVSVSLLSWPVVTAIGLGALSFNLYYFKGFRQNQGLLEVVSERLQFLGAVYASVYGLVSVLFFLKLL